MKPAASRAGLLRPCVTVFAVMTLITGFAYPAAVTLIANVAFPQQANGSLIEHDGRTVGSRLLGQAFTQPGYFWSRPSATSPHAYNGAASSGSNLGPSNPILLDSIRARASALRAPDPGNSRPIPVDLVTASGSGLDPHISPAAADFQVERVAQARGLDPGRVRHLVAEHTEQRTLGLLGEPRVNVLELNLALDALSSQ